MKRGAEVLGGASKRQAVAGGGGPFVAVPQTQFCVKVLCNDALVMMILGDVGSRRESIQKETGTELVFSNKGDYFPGSNFRVLGIFGNDLRNIHDACEFITNDIVECGVKESDSAEHPENLGKEPGEYIARLVVSKASSGALIGPGGGNIKAMRQETGCKVFIDNDTIMGHQLVRLIGSPESVLFALDQVNEFSQAEAGTPEFQSWSELINFDQAAQTMSHPLADHNLPGRGRGERGSREEGCDDHRGGRPGRAPPPGLAKTRLCHFFQQGKCKFGDGCLNAHGEEDLRLPEGGEEFELGGSGVVHASGAPRSKSKLCAFFLQGRCKFGKGCQNAHGEAELMADNGSAQPPPPKGKAKGKEKGKDRAAEPALQTGPGSLQFKPPGGGGALGPSMFDGGMPVPLLGPPGRELGPPLGPPGRERAPSFPPTAPGLAPFGPPVGEQTLRPGLQPAMGMLREAVDSLPEGTQDLQYSITWELPASHVAPLIGKGGENSQVVERMTGVSVNFGKGAGKASSDKGQCSAVGPLYGIYAAHMLMVKKSYEIERRDSDQMRERELQEQQRQSERKRDLERRAETMQRQLDQRRQEDEQRMRLEEMRRQRELEQQQRALEEQEREVQNALDSPPRFPPQPPRLSWMVPERGGSSPPAGPDAGELPNDAEAEQDDAQIENEILNEWGAAPSDEEPPDGFGGAEEDGCAGESWEQADGEHEGSVGDALNGLDPTNQEDLQATLANLQAQLAKVQAMAAAAKAQPAGPGRPKGPMQGKGKGKTKTSRPGLVAGH